MEEWQGPALYVYNDAVFSEGDFESISHVGRSGKQDDLAKIGAPCLCPAPFLLLPLRALTARWLRRQVRPGLQLRVPLY